MTVLLVAALAVAAALIQIGPLSLLIVDTTVAPVLPVAVIAGWGAARRADETWLALMLVPAVLGVTSQDRVGAFVVALWPTAVLALLVHGLDGAPGGRSTPRIAAAALAAAGGWLCYVTLFAMLGGDVTAVVAHPQALVAAATVTTLAGIIVALALWPWRPRPRGLFE